MREMLNSATSASLKLSWDLRAPFPARERERGCILGSTVTDFGCGAGTSASTLLGLFDIRVAICIVRAARTLRGALVGSGESLLDCESEEHRKRLAGSGEGCSWSCCTSSPLGVIRGTRQSAASGHASSVAWSGVSTPDMSNGMGSDVEGSDEIATLSR